MGDQEDQKIRKRRRGRREIAKVVVARNIEHLMTNERTYDGSTVMHTLGLVGVSGSGRS